MSKKLSVTALILVLVFTVALVGCSKKQEPKAAVSAAAANAAKMTSYEVNSKFVINDLTVTSPDVDSNPNIGMAMSMLKNADVTVDGIYQKEPMQSEMSLGIHLKGDMAMNFAIPMVITKEKIYVKIPSIPMFPMPQDIVGKFLVLDPKQLAEQSGEEFNPAMMDTDKTQKLSNEIVNAVLGEYDQAKYFKDIAPKDANLPEGVDAKQVVQFKVTNDNVKEAANTFVSKALPKVLDILGKDEYANMLSIKKEEIAQAKKDLETNSTETAKELENLKNTLKVNQFDVNMALNKDDFPVYQSMVANLEVNDTDSKTNVKFSATGSSKYSKINEKATFKIGIPSGDQVITMEQLQQKMGASQ